MHALSAFASFSQTVMSRLGRAWTQFWFQPSSTTPLEIVRIGLGGALLFHYAMATPFLFVFWGDDGWLPRSAALELVPGPWMQSVFFYFTAPWQWIAFHALFLFCCAAFVAGWRTPWVKWIVLVGQLSYDYRNLQISYGAHSITACLLLILCFAPVGRAISLDRVRAVRFAKRGNLEATLPPYMSPWANACTRLMQIQMATLFFYSGVEKIRGDDWWSGDAIWIAFTLNEFYNRFVVWLLAHQYWLVSFATYATIFIEIAYAFLIWRQRTRPYLLAAAVSLHLAFAIGFGLVYFSFVMITGHMIFLRQEWLANLNAWWNRKLGEIEMIYDSHCSFCVRSMAWLLAFDGMKQIRVRDVRFNPSPEVAGELVEKRLCVLLPDGRVLPGFEAYRHVALRVPGLWWLVPFLYLPLASRWLARPIYHWAATRQAWPLTFRRRSPRTISSIATGPTRHPASG